MVVFDVVEHFEERVVFERLLRILGEESFDVVGRDGVDDGLILLPPYL